MTTRAAWAQMLLQQGGFVDDPAHVVGVIAWQIAEGSTAATNPLDTTQDAPGATDYNSVGVKNYPSLEVGLDATLETLRNGFYAPILTELATNPGSATGLARAVAASPWGTQDFSAVCESVAGNFAAYANQEVPGTPPTPAGTPIVTEPPPPSASFAQAVQQAGPGVIGADVVQPTADDVHQLLDEFWNNQFYPQLHAILAQTQANGGGISELHGAVAQLQLAVSQLTQAQGHAAAADASEDAAEDPKSGTPASGSTPPAGG